MRCADEYNVDQRVLIYLNRLSDLLFVWARLANHRAGIADVLWIAQSETKDRP